MSTASYKNLILQAVTDVLRPMGFHKSGSRFHRGLNDVIHLVTVQSSVSSTAHLLRITVNLGIWLPALADEGDKPNVWSAHWRERIGFLMPERADRWWEASSESEATAAALEICWAMRTFALTTLDTLSTADALAALWRSGRSPGLTERGAQRYLELLSR